MKKTILALSMMAFVSSKALAVTIAGQYGIFTDSQGNALPNDTFWFLAADTDGNSVLPGGLGLNSSIGASSEEDVAAAFGGTTISLGSVLGGDTVFAMGGLDDFGGFAPLGTVTPFLTFNLGENGAVAGAAYAIYVFPGVIYGGAASVELPNQPFEIIGIQTSVADGELGGMVLPNSNADFVTQGAATEGYGGTMDPGQFTATVIPEPSTALVGLLGVGLLALRRRRD